MKKLTCLLLAMVLFLSACAPSIEERIEDYADETITIVGLGETFTVTPRELAKLELETVSATGATAKAGTIRITGPSLETFLAHYGYSVSDVSKVRFICYDDYKIVLKKTTLREYDIILGLADSDAPLEEKRRPLRLLIPGEESGKWAYGVTTIEFVLEDAS